MAGRLRIGLPPPHALLEALPSDVGGSGPGRIAAMDTGAEPDRPAVAVGAAQGCDDRPDLPRKAGREGGCYMVQDMVLGLYYLSIMNENEPPRPTGPVLVK